MKMVLKVGSWGAVAIVALLAWYAFPDAGGRIVVSILGAALVYYLNLAHETIQVHTSQLAQLHEKVSILMADKVDRELWKKLEKTEFYTVRDQP